MLRVDGHKRLTGGQPTRRSTVWFALAIVGPLPEGWETRRWAYKECTFATSEIPSPEFAGYISSGIHELKLGSDVVQLGFPESTIQCWRHASCQKYAGIEVPWPSITYDLNFTERVQSGPNGYLSTMDAPSFPAFSTAFRAFFYNERVITGVGQPTFGQLTLSVAEEGARIARVVVGAASLDVWVDGHKVAGTRLELNSTTDQVTISIEGPGRYTFPLTHGLGQDAWIWLKGEGGYVDYRPLSGWGGSRSAGVEIAAPEDPVADLSALAAQGESTWLEYKRQLPSDSKESKRTVLKTVVAFANGEGGTLLFGVDGDDDTGQIVGVPGDAPELQRRVNDLLRALITPTPPSTVSAHDIEGKCVIRVDTVANQGILYALVVDANRPEYYVRRNGSTYFARPEELAALVKPAPSAGPFGFMGLG